MTSFGNNNLLLTASDTMTSLTDLNRLLNTSWVDLLAGIHFNLLQPHLVLENMTLESVCRLNTTLKEPEGGDGSFLKAVERLCDLADSSRGIYEDYLYLRVGYYLYFITFYLLFYPSLKSSHICVPRMPHRIIQGWYPFQFVLEMFCGVLAHFYGIGIASNISIGLILCYRY